MMSMFDYRFQEMVHIFPWLAKPYPQGPALTGIEKCFNHKMSSAPVVAERTLGILKARQCCLLKIINTEIANVTDQVITCSVLHNTCQENGQEYIDMNGFLAKILRSEREARQRVPQVFNVFHDER